MRSPLLLLCCVWLGCDVAGPDLDAGVSDQCFDVPPRYDGGICVERTSNQAPPCKASLAQARAFARGNCDGGVLEGSCSGVTALRWVTGAPSDGYECFYLPDGGLSGGVITYAGKHVFSGRLADCSLAPSAQACDGGP